jgi:hypothetical protein
MVTRPNAEHPDDVRVNDRTEKLLPICKWFMIDIRDANLAAQRTDMEEPSSRFATTLRAQTDPTRVSPCTERPEPTRTKFLMDIELPNSMQL